MKKLICFGTTILFLVVFGCVASENLYSNSFDLSSGENGKSPTILLNSGYRMPIFGIGTFQLHGDTCYNSVLSALQNGYRLIDTAYIYGNEDKVGEAIKKSGVWCRSLRKINDRKSKIQICDRYEDFKIIIN